MSAHLSWAADANHGLVLKLVDGVSDEAAFAELVPGGSHLNWLLAHLVASRDSMLALLGAERVRTEEFGARYGYGSQPPARAEAEPFAELVSAYVASGERLTAALAALTSERLEQPAGRSTVRQQLEFMLWHETYHLGQAMLYRRAAGLASPIG